MKDRQTILAVDEKGNFLEYIPRELGHSGSGKRHLAISVLVENSQGEVLLQKRKHQVFDDIWDMTASTHQLHLADHDESNKEATLRALEDEYGIKSLENLEEVGAINYFAEYGKFCENEHDIILIGLYNGPIVLNKLVAYEYKWIDKKAFIQDIEHNPSRYSPWSIEAVKLLKENNYFKK